MQPPTAAADVEQVAHVVFDPRTGRILGTMHHDPHPEGDCDCEDDEDALLAFVPSAATDAPLPRIAPMPERATTRLRQLRIDPATRRAEPLPRLVIEPARHTIEGDGEDTVAVEIRAVDEDGAVVSDYAGEVQLRAGRGKLSERRGIVQLREGRATVDLTSVRETVEDVPLDVVALDATATPARTTVTFA